MGSMSGNNAAGPLRPRDRPLKSRLPPEVALPPPPLRKIPCAAGTVVLGTFSVTAAPLPAPASLLAADLARRVGLILAAVAALVARRFLREPRLVGLIVPLWSRLNRSARRFERLMARIAAGTLPAPRRVTARPVHPLPPPRRAGLPTGRGWLVRALGHEAAGCASQLEHLLAEPGAAGLVAATPAAQRILRPLRHMLGVGPATRRRTARAAPPRRPREPRPLPPKPLAYNSLAAPGGGEGQGQVRDSGVPPGPPHPKSPPP